MVRCSFASAEIIADYNAKKYEELQNDRGRYVCSIIRRLCCGKYYDILTT